MELYLHGPHTHSRNVAKIRGNLTFGIYLPKELLEQFSLIAILTYSTFQKLDLYAVLSDIDFVVFVMLSFALFSRLF
jgi:hypothetical protein